MRTDQRVYGRLTTLSVAGTEEDERIVALGHYPLRYREPDPLVCTRY
jgi:hypothetical protein